MGRKAMGQAFAFGVCGGGLLARFPVLPLPRPG